MSKPGHRTPPASEHLQAMQTMEESALRAVTGGCISRKPGIIEVEVEYGIPIGAIDPKTCLKKRPS